MTVYDRFLEKSVLLPKHHTELKDRGFNEDTISRCKFCSGGKHNEENHQYIVEGFTEDELIKSCAFVRDVAGIIRMAPQLLQDKIIIPYIDNAGKCYNLRPHKLGLSGKEAELYQTANFSGTDVILTEGEFKAAAGMQLGINTVAVPGISSFAGEHLGKLVITLKEYGVKNIVVMFDNEDKVNPKSKHYKEDPLKRWDTQYYAQYMAYRLQDVGFNAYVATLPDEWRVDGKIDIDGALKVGKTREDLLHLIHHAKKYNEYVANLPEEGRKIIQKRISRIMLRSSLLKQNGRYVIAKKNKKDDDTQVEYIPISNFTMDLKNTYVTSEGIMREVVFKSCYGDVSRPVLVTPEAMASSDQFTTFCLRHGDFVWSGQRMDVLHLWESELLNNDGRHIVELDHVGYCKEENAWVLGNAMICEDGTEIKINDGVYWIEDKGVKPVPLSYTTGKMSINEGIPMLDKSSKVDINELKNKLGDTIGQMQANLMIGWAVAVMFYEEVFAEWGCFPFMCVAGKKGSGKSTICMWLMHIFGMDGVGKRMPDTTPVAMQRYMAYYSCIPLWLDEYRNSREVQNKDGILRNAYNRLSAGKGMKNDFGIREAKIRSTVLLSGEETPNDNALLTRCIAINIALVNRKENHYKWFQTYKRKFSSIMYNILRAKKKLLPGFMENMRKAKDLFVASGCDDRTAVNYSVVAAGFFALYHPDGVPEDDKSAVEFATWIQEESRAVYDRNESEHQVKEFFEDILVLKSMGKIPVKLWSYNKQENEIYLYFRALYNMWSQEYQKLGKDRVPFKLPVILQYVTEEPGYKSLGRNKRIEGLVRRCVVFDYANSSETLRQLVDDDNEAIVAQDDSAQTQRSVYEPTVEQIYLPNEIVPVENVVSLPPQQVVPPIPEQNPREDYEVPTK